MSTTENKHDWRPGLIAGAADLPVGIAAGAGGAFLANQALKSKISKAVGDPAKLAKLTKLHGVASHIGTGVIAGGAALAYTDFLQRKHEKQLRNSNMSNKYLEKIAAMTTEQSNAVNGGYDRPWMHAAGGAMLGTMAGGAVGAAAGMIAKNPALAAVGRIGRIAGSIGGGVAGYQRAKKRNEILDGLVGTEHEAERTKAVLRDGKKSHLEGFLFSPAGIGGYMDTTKSNNRYTDVVAKATRGE